MTTCGNTYSSTYYWPDDPCVQIVDFGLVTRTQSFSSPLSGVDTTYELEGAKWSGTFQLPPLTKAQAREWRALLVRLAGPAGAFWGTDPAYQGSEGLVAGVDAITGQTPLLPTATLQPSTTLYPSAQNFSAIAAATCIELAEAASAGDEYITVTGFPTWDYSNGVNPNYEALAYSGFLFGDYLEMPNCPATVGGQFLMVTGEVSLTSPGGAEGVVRIAPKLRSDVAVQSSCCIDYTTPKVRMRLVDDMQAGWRTEPLPVYSITFAGVEIIDP